MWETVAKEHDPFICMNLIAPDLNELNESDKLNFQSLDELHTFIKDNILGKLNEELIEV